MGGGNAFLRFSSSVAAGALILNQVARAQECVKTYEGCGSCEDPTLRFLTTVVSESLTPSTSIKYINCAGEPFPGQDPITLENINSDITSLTVFTSDAKDYVSVVSFPCMTDFSRSVSFGDPNVFPSLQKIRFANLKTVDGFIAIAILPALISIFAPLLQSATQIAIQDNNLLPKIDLPSLSVVEDGVDIEFNENLKKISLPQLTTTANNGFFLVFGNQKLQKLCASKLENGGAVCIGNDQNQPFLDADLSELVTGSLSSNPFCYTDSNAAPTVCGNNGTGGLFSTDGCPSNACS